MQLESRLVLSAAKGHGAIVQNLGNLSGAGDFSMNGTLKSTHKSGIYEFNTTVQERFQGELSGLTHPASIELVGSNKQFLGFSYATRATSGSINETLNPGTYLVQVESASRAKTNYRLSLSGQATYVPPAPAQISTPKAPPPSTPVNAPATTTTTPPATTPSNPPSNPNTVALTQFFTELREGTTLSVALFFKDAATQELSQPTLLGGVIKQQLIQVGEDAEAGQNVQAFQDIQTVGQTMFTEATDVVTYHLSPSYAILANPAVVRDLEIVAFFKDVTYVVASYIATHTQYHATTTTPTAPVWNTGLVAPTASSTINIQPIVAPTTQTAISHSFTAVNTQVGSYLSSWSTQNLNAATDEQAAYDFGSQLVDPDDIADMPSVGGQDPIIGNNDVISAVGDDSDRGSTGGDDGSGSGGTGGGENPDGY